MAGATQFQSSCIGQAIISDHKAVVRMATTDMAENEMKDSVVYCVLIVLLIT